MVVQKLKDFLEANRVHYDIMPHLESHTAQQTAASVHVPGKEMAKTIMIKIDGKTAMAVLPSNFKINFNQLRIALGCQECQLMSESEFSSVFPNCETGAMPPFGVLWNMETYVSESLANNVYITFNAGNHHEAIRMTYMDYAGLVQPTTLKFSEKLQI